MAKSAQESREERKLRFIEMLKRKQARDLVEPLCRKANGFLAGEVAVEDVFKAVHAVAAQSEKVTKRFRNRPDVVLAEIAMDENKFTTDMGEIGVKARLGDLTALFVDAIVNPADPRGVMASGVAAAIKAAGGETIEKEAVAKAPLAAGKAIATSAGTLPILHVIHVAVADEPGGQSSRANVRAAAAAALALAEELGLESVAIPGLGTGAGGVSPPDAAAALLEAIAAHPAKSLVDVTLVGRDEAVVGAFDEALEAWEEAHQ